MANVKYTVVTHNVPRPAYRSDFVKMKDKNGKEFECVMPSKMTEEQDAHHVEEQKQQAERSAKSEQELPSLDSLLAPLTGRCFLRPDGYWNFEVTAGELAGDRAEGLRSSAMARSCDSSTRRGGSESLWRRGDETVMLCTGRRQLSTRSGTSIKVRGPRGEQSEAEAENLEEEERDEREKARDCRFLI
eukprot:766550-Hanusia_phi.AAC.6